MFISLFSLFYSLSPDSSWLISFSSFLIVSIILYSLIGPPFQHLQFLSNLVQYSSLYLLSVHLYNFFAVNFSSKSSLLNIPFSLFCFQIFSMSCWYSLPNSSTTSFVFPRFSISSQVSDSAVNSFHCTKYLSFPLTYCLFSILLTSYSSSPSIITGAGCFFFCPSTCPMYLCILLTFTTGYIFTVLDNCKSNQSRVAPEEILVYNFLLSFF